MAILQYHEVQRFSQIRWLWIVAGIILFTPVVMFSLTDQDFTQNKFLPIITVLFAAAPVVVILFAGKFELKVTEEGLQYRFFPSVIKWKMINITHVDTIEIRDKRGLFEKVACGYKHSLFKKSVFMNISGTRFVILKMADGKRYKIGSHQAEEFGFILKRLRQRTNEA